MRYNILFTAVMMLSVAAGASAQDNISLNGTWDFALQKPGEKTPENLNSTIEVPSCWAVLGWEEPVYRGFRDDKAASGYYRKTFELPQGWEDRRVLLHFDGVWACATPVLNGKELGIHDSGYTSFSYEVTGILRPGTNILEVKVDQASRYYKFDTNDDWTLGGIYRDVWLESMPLKRWMEHPTVTTTFDRRFKDGHLTVKTIVCDAHKSKVAGNFPSPGEAYRLTYTLKDADGRTVLQESMEVEGQDATDKEIVREFDIKSVRKWNAEDPYLYDLTVELSEDGKTVHTRRQHVGFRQIDIDNGVFKVNGVPVKLRGVNRHDEHPDVGRATRREHWLKDITMMKDANVNYIRLAHYTPAPGFIALCDSLGMYVSNEISLGGGDEHFRDPSYAEGTLLRVYETVARDINAPSIIFWTVGNEDPFTSIHLTARKMLKALDPSRPAAMPWRAEYWLPEEFEILAPHYWQPAEYGSLARNSSRPIISTEYTHAYGLYATGGLEARWKALTSHPNGTGAAVWMWQDQGIRTPVLPQTPSALSDDPYLRLDGQGWDGITDSDRNPTRDLEEVKAVYAQAYPTVESVKAARTVRIPIRNDFDFTDLSSVTVEWEQFADGQAIASGAGRLRAPAHSTRRLKLRIKEASGRYANYIMLRFIRPDGSEITRRSVELVTRKKEDAVPYGEYIRIDDFLSGIRPVIWHHLDDTEFFMYSSSEKDILENLDPDRYEARTLSSEFTEEEGLTVVKSKVLYTIDEENSFTGDFEFRFTDRSIDVKYTLTPDVQLSWIPVYGMAYTPKGLKSVSWVGRGPQDGYVNKDSAPQFGMWEYTGGFKSARSILCELWEGTLKIDLDGYLEINPKRPGEILLLGEVVSRPEKGRKAAAPFPLLRCTEDAPFSGEFTISLHPEAVRQQ